MRPTAIDNNIPQDTKQLTSLNTKLCFILYKIH